MGKWYNRAGRSNNSIGDRGNKIEYSIKNIVEIMFDITRGIDLNFTEYPLNNLPSFLVMPAIFRTSFLFLLAIIKTSKLTIFIIHQFRGFTQTLE